MQGVTGNRASVCVCVHMNAHRCPSMLFLLVGALWGDVGVKVSHASARHGGQSSKCVCFIAAHVFSSVLLWCVLCDVGVSVSHASARHGGQSRWCVCACALVLVSTVFAHVAFCWAMLV